MAQLLEGVREFVFNVPVPPTAKVIWRRGYGSVLYNRLEEPEIKLETLVQGEWCTRGTVFCL